MIAADESTGSNRRACVRGSQCFQETVLHGGEAETVEVVGNGLPGGKLGGMPSKGEQSLERSHCGLGTRVLPPLPS